MSNSIGQPRPRPVKHRSARTGKLFETLIIGSGFALGVAFIPVAIWAEGDHILITHRLGLLSFSVGLISLSTILYILRNYRGKI